VPKSWFVGIIAVNLVASALLVTFAPLQVRKLPMALYMSAPALTR